MNAMMYESNANNLIKAANLIKGIFIFKGFLQKGLFDVIKIQQSHYD